jgi:hypothetical protein
MLHVQAANRRKLAVAGATGSKVMKLNDAMQNLTECSRFAGEQYHCDPCILAYMSHDERHSNST